MEEVFEPTVFLRYHRSLRGILIDNQPWLVARELGYLIRERVEPFVIHRLDDDLRRQVRLITATGEETVWVINDFGTFHVLQRYRNPEHRELRQWLTGEVLPALRDQALLATDSPRRLLAKGEGRPVTLLDWQGQLWIALTQMPQLMREERRGGRGWWRMRGE
ncbi:BRO-N domain-containing protein [Pseudomonas panipatensis]|jgi:prophage antirepressor-like protein|uniref:Prophage antirepressor n=1 Tax=Pseudomonas panipatensis TaxID=428992 RepID=A0A1G8EMK4_9PSED|nr:BRO family protein [Pseudomonas panipatensis]SDH71111.1 Prophage antirepressor [Pseudomonas panipatensis]SMP68401.1 Prophage antirepressor [Pseudomonas panipatensis]